MSEEIIQDMLTFKPGSVPKRKVLMKHLRRFDVFEVKNSLVMIAIPKRSVLSKLGVLGEEIKQQQDGNVFQGYAYICSKKNNSSFSPASKAALDPFLCNMSNFIVIDTVKKVTKVKGKGVFASQHVLKMYFIQEPIRDHSPVIMDSASQNTHFHEPSKLVLKSEVTNMYGFNGVVPITVGFEN